MVERKVQVLPVGGSGVEIDSKTVPRFALDEVAALGTFRVVKRGWRQPVQVCCVFDGCA